MGKKRVTSFSAGTENQPLVCNKQTFPPGNKFRWCKNMLKPPLDVSINFSQIKNGFACLFWPPHPNIKKCKNKQEEGNLALLMACRTYIPNPVSEWWFVNESAFPSIHLFVSKQAVTHRAGTSCLPVPLTSPFGEPLVLSARSSPQDKHWHGQLQS